MKKGFKFVGVVCRFVAGAASLGAFQVGCGAERGDSPIEEGSLAQVEFSLATVPTSVQCVRVTAAPTSGSATSVNFTVAAGSSSASLVFNKLAPGAYTFSGQAFNVACASIGSVGDWVSNTVPLTLQAGVTSNATLTFRKNSPPTITANFINGATAVACSQDTTWVATDAGIVHAGLYAGGSKTFVRASFSMFDATTVPGNAIVQLGATRLGVCAMRADGTVWCWGSNEGGELGPGIPLGLSSTTPAQVTGLSGATQLATGSMHTCAVGTVSGTQGLYCWGSNASGQFGRATPTSSATPILAASGPFKQIAAGGVSTYYVDTFANVFATGDNFFGQLGDGTTTSRTTFVPSAKAPVRKLAAGAEHACALREDGTVQCWGLNAGGELGLGTTVSSSVPVLVPGVSATDITAGESHTCVISTDGQTRCWGANSSGQIGDGTATTRLVPTVVSFGSLLPPATPSTPTLALLAAPGMSDSSCGLSASRDLYCWGYNQVGQLGNGTINNLFLPTRPQLP